jgi:D-lactate dehydrogenase (cytochrome)
VKNKEDYETNLEIISSKEKIENYLTDESRIIKGYAEELILVKSEQDVINAIKYAISQRKRITVSGAGTGITGSRVPLDGIILSMEDFTEVYKKPNYNEEFITIEEYGKKYSIIIGKDEKGECYAIASAGIPLKIFKKLVESKNLFYPPDPTETSSFLGGNVATNASGSRTFKYGSTRDYVRRLRIVLPTGNVLDIRRGEHFFNRKRFELKVEDREIILELPDYKMPNVEKNAAGYYIKENMDLIDLFIGSEGTLGVITEIEVKLIKKPNFINAIFVYFDEEIKAVEFAKLIRAKAKSEELPISAIEFFDENSVNFIRDKYSDKIPSNAKAIIDLEIESESIDERDRYFEKLLKHVDEFKAEAYLLEINEAKEIRHALPQSVNNFIKIHGTRKVATDIAVPEENFFEMYKYYHEIGKASQIKYVLFGHIGNFHLHFNFLPSNKDELEKAERYVVLLWKKGVELGGTISAEHGVGKKYYVENGVKKPLISLMYNEETMLKLIELKKTIDPYLILNIGNIIPEEYFR